MTLTAATVFHYLRDRGFLSSAAAQDSFSVSELRHRHLTLLVQAGSLGYAVKQAGSTHRQASVVSEAAWYWLCQNDLRFEPIRPLLPTAHSWDPKNFILILDRLPFIPLWDLDAIHRFHPGRAARIGEAAATVHASTTWLPHAAQLKMQFPGNPSTFVNYHAILSGQSLEPLSKGGKQFHEVIRKQSGFEPLLRPLLEDWNPQALTHGDWKLPNCLVDPLDPDAPIRMLDWELADAGEPLWDCGTILQSYWYDWVLNPNEVHLDSIRPALHAFWNAYASASPFGSANGARTMAVRFAAARMLQTAWEQAKLGDSLTAPVVRLVQASWNIIENPKAAEAVFFEL